MGLSKLFLVAQLAPSLVLEKRICQEFLITTRDNYQQFASAEHRKFVAARCHFLRLLGRNWWIAGVC